MGGSSMVHYATSFLAATETHSLPRETHVSRKRQSDRDRLRTLIETLSFAQGSFTLASGRKSEAFFDMKQTMLEPEGANLLAESLLKLIIDENIKAEFVGGLELGAVPLLTNVCMKSFGTVQPLRGFIVRKEAKDHGKQEQISGGLTENSRVIILDDVTTTGGSAIQAVKKVVELKNCMVSAVISVVDRQEGAVEAFDKLGIPFYWLFQKSDFLKTN